LHSSRPCVAPLHISYQYIQHSRLNLYGLFSI
jgi:hypothetical protein